MKLFSFIFAFLILALSAVPCCATGDCRAESQHAPAQKNDQRDDDCRNCSPFALCGNCTGFTIPIHAVKIKRFPVPIARAYSNYVQSDPAEYCTSFWHPPKAAFFLPAV